MSLSSNTGKAAGPTSTLRVNDDLYFQVPRKYRLYLSGRFGCLQFQVRSSTAWKTAIVSIRFTKLVAVLFFTAVFADDQLPFGSRLRRQQDSSSLYGVERSDFHRMVAMRHTWGIVMNRALSVSLYGERLTSFFSFLWEWAEGRR